MLERDTAETERDAIALTMDKNPKRGSRREGGCDGLRETRMRLVDGPWP